MGVNATLIDDDFVKKMKIREYETLRTEILKMPGITIGVIKNSKMRIRTVKFGVIPVMATPLQLFS